MNTIQLRESLRRDPETRRQLGDVCAADELPALVSRRPNLFIVNTDSGDKPGRHWTAFYFPVEGPAEFFDPVGRAPEDYLRRFKNVLLVNGPRYSYNGHRVQDFKTDTCGYFCLYFAYRRCRGQSMTQIVNTFSDRYFSVNEKTVRHLVDHRR